MANTIILSTLLNLFATSPDLCAVPYLDMTGAPCTDSIGQTLSRYCEWTGPDAPVLGKDVCCVTDSESATCWMPDARGGCGSGSKWSCEHGEQLADGRVVCYQSFPSACDFGLCVHAPDVPPTVVADLICCMGESCTEIEKEGILDCLDNEGFVTWCSDGMSNVDGTVTCFD
jgi:hypothetical protein